MSLQNNPVNSNNININGQFIQAQQNHQRYQINQPPVYIENQRNQNIGQNQDNLNQENFYQILNEEENNEENRPRLKKMDKLFAYQYKKYKSQFFLLGLIQLIFFAYLLIKSIIIYFQKFSKSTVQSHQIKDNWSIVLLIGCLLFLQFCNLIMRSIIYLKDLKSVNFAIKAANHMGHISQEQFNQSQNFQQNITNTTYRHHYSQPLYEYIDSKIIYIKIKQTIRLNNSIVIRILFTFLMIVNILWFSTFIILSFIFKYQSISHQYIYFVLLFLFWCYNVDLCSGSTQQIYSLFCSSILILFFPIICIAFLIFTIYQKCRQSNTQRNGLESNANRNQRKQLPVTHRQPRNPTYLQIMAYGNSCSICLIGFTTNDQVLFFPCQGRHMFHSICLNGWLNVKSTCPNCRTRL